VEEEEEEAEEEAGAFESVESIPPSAEEQW
jgi:hypothetical protein